jgi:hypothetical protein
MPSRCEKLSSILVVEQHTILLDLDQVIVADIALTTRKSQPQKQEEKALYWHRKGFV